MAPFPISRKSSFQRSPVLLCDRALPLRFKERRAPSNRAGCAFSAARTLSAAGWIACVASASWATHATSKCLADIGIASKISSSVFSPGSGRSQSSGQWQIVDWNSSLMGLMSWLLKDMMPIGRLSSTFQIAPSFGWFGIFKSMTLTIFPAWLVKPLRPRTMMAKSPCLQFILLPPAPQMDFGDPPRRGLCGFWMHTHRSGRGARPAHAQARRWPESRARFQCPAWLLPAFRR